MSSNLHVTILTKNEIKGIEQWTSAMPTLGSIYCEWYPNQSPGILKYIATVSDMHFHALGHIGSSRILIPKNQSICWMGLWICSLGAVFPDHDTQRLFGYPSRLSSLSQEWQRLQKLPTNLEIHTDIVGVSTGWDPVNGNSVHSSTNATGALKTILCTDVGHPLLNQKIPLYARI